MKWIDFKNMVDKKLLEQRIGGHIPDINPEILYIDFNEYIEPDDIDMTRLGLIIVSGD